MDIFRRFLDKKSAPLPAPPNPEGVLQLPPLPAPPVVLPPKAASKPLSLSGIVPISVRIPTAQIDIRVKMNRGQFHAMGRSARIVQVLIAKIVDVVTHYGDTPASLQIYTDYCADLEAAGSFEGISIDTRQVFDIVSRRVAGLDGRRGNITALEQRRAEIRERLQQCLQWGFMLEAMDIFDPEGRCSRTQVSFERAPEYDISVAVPRCKGLENPEPPAAPYWPTSLLDPNLHDSYVSGPRDTQTTTSREFQHVSAYPRPPQVREQIRPRGI